MKSTQHAIKDNSTNNTQSLVTKKGNEFYCFIFANNIIKMKLDKKIL